MQAVSVFDHQLAAVVFIGISKEERRGEIGTHAMRCSRYLSNRIVDVVSKRLPVLITIEEWRKNFQRQSSRHEQRVAFERGDDRVAELSGVFVIFGKLQVVFGARGLVARGDAAVDPIGGFEQLATTRNLFGIQNVWNL